MGLGRGASRGLRDLPPTILSSPKVGSVGRTGSWRLSRPVINYDRCTKCLLCWIYCPEGCISRAEDEKPIIDYDYCKGCGICAKECPMDSILMEMEEV